MFQKIKSLVRLITTEEPIEKRTEKVVSTPTHSVNGYFQPLSAPVLLQHERRRQWLKTLWEYSALPKERFDTYFLPPLHHVVELCQRLPASDQGKYAYSDGMVDYILQTTVYAVRLSKGYMLPRGATAEEQSAQSVSWSAVVYYSALFHSLGDLWNIEGELHSGRVWLPGLTIPVEPYRFRFKSEPDALGAELFGEMIAVRFVPEAVFQWLGKTPVIMRTLLAFLGGRYRDAADITDIVNEAIMHAGGKTLSDRCNVPAELESPVIDMSASLVPVAELSQTSVNPLEVPKTDDSGQQTIALISALDSMATPKETDISCSDIADPDVSQVMSILGTLGASPTEIINNVDISGVMEEGACPVDTVVSALQVVEHDLQQHSISEPFDLNGDSISLKNGLSGAEVTDSLETMIPEVPLLSSSEVGSLFWTWLQKGLVEGDIPVNSIDASVHLTCGFIFIRLPNIFFNFLRDHPQLQNVSKEQVQVGFERQGKHRISGSQRFWGCHLYEEKGWKGRHKRLTGYLIKMSMIYPAGHFPSDSIFLKVTK